MRTAVVGQGIDGDYFGRLVCDFDEIANTFSLSAPLFSNYSGISSCVGSGDIVSWALTSLDFGTPLAGAAILSGIGGAVVDSFTANAVFFHWTEDLIPRGTFLTLQFQTAAVPLPAGGLLLAGVLVALRRRRKLT